jgi:RsiW-degrading membrane proteinase PrsW (M82 family)
MNGFLVSLAAGFLPMFLYAWLLYYLDRYEKEPHKLLVGMFLWGSLIAASAAFVINSFSSIGIYLFTQSNIATQLVSSALIAPFVEETLKGAAVLIVFILFRPEFDSPLDGIVYAGIAALGFAATENVWYIHQFGFLQNGYQGLLEITLVRVLLVGWQHPFYTAFTGLGFALARQSNESAWRWVFPLLGWSFAVAFHLLHNLISVLAANTGRGGLLNLIWDWSGYLGLLFLILLLIKREQKWMKTYLAPERDRGVIDSRHYQIACSAWHQGFEFLRSLLKGNTRQVRRFYQICGDLMHKIRQGVQLGNGSEVKADIEHLRQELISRADKL